jgi:hypothetical protein
MTKKKTKKNNSQDEKINDDDGMTPDERLAWLRQRVSSVQ